jgi:RimJ/RimL family protein N-acetyltransferase
MQPVGGKADPASAGKYLAQWERRFVLDHDLKALVRPVKPDDHRLIQDLFAHMSRSDLRLRFFDSMKEISPKLMRRLTQFDYSRAIAFIMIDQSNGRALGVVRLHGDEGRESAEFAIAVRSDLKGRGLGWLMMQLIIEYGRSAGFARIYGQILQENTVMLKMCRELGFETRVTGADPGVREVSLTLSDSMKQ